MKMKKKSNILMFPKQQHPIVYSDFDFDSDDDQDLGFVEVRSLSEFCEELKNQFIDEINSELTPFVQKLDDGSLVINYETLKNLLLQIRFL